jgi:hypothetical protein
MYNASSCVFSASEKGRGPKRWGSPSLGFAGVFLQKLNHIYGCIISNCAYKHEIRPFLFQPKVLIGPLCSWSVCDGFGLRWPRITSSFLYSLISSLHRSKPATTNAAGINSGVAAFEVHPFHRSHRRTTIGAVRTTFAADRFLPTAHVAASGTRHRLPPPRGWLLLRLRTQRLPCA